MKYLPLFNFVTLGVLAILSTLLSMRFKKSELPWKLITIYLIGSFIAQAIAYGYWMMKWNNLKFFHLYSLFQFVSFSIFYYSIARSKTKKQLIFLLSGLISILLITNSVFNESIKEFNSIGIFISNGTIVLYAIAYFFEVLGADVHSRKYLIINAGILLFISESLVIFLFGNLLKGVAQIDHAILWYTNATIYLTFLLLILWNHVKFNR